MIELYYGWIIVFKGDGRSALKHLENSLNYFDEQEAPLFLAQVSWGLGMGHHLLGELEAARNHLQKGLKMMKDMESPFILSYFYYGLSMIHLDSGEFENAQSFAEKALDFSQKNNEKWAEGISLNLMGRILGKKEPPEIERAEEHILQGIKILEELKSKPFYSQGYLFLGELNADTGQKEKALENLNKAEKMFQEMGMDYWLAKTQEVLKKV